MATPVSEFYAKIGMQVDQKSLKAVDKFFAGIEKRMGALGSTLNGRQGTVSGLQGVAKETKAVADAEKRRSNERSRQVRQTVTDNARLYQSEKKLAEVINRNLGIGSRGGHSRGDNQRLYNDLFGLNSRLTGRYGRSTTATSRLSGLSSAEARIKSNSGSRVEDNSAKIQLAAAKMQAQTAKMAERNRIAEERRATVRRGINETEAIRQRNRIALEAEKRNNKLAIQEARVAGRSSAARVQRGNYLAMGGAGGAFARYGAGSLPFIGGMYGIASLNNANQQFMSREISTSAIFGKDAVAIKERLGKHADYVGYNYLETLPIFTQFMAAAKDTMGLGAGTDVFESVTEFGRTRGADTVGMQRGLRALQQMASKGKVTSEELDETRLAA